MKNRQDKKLETAVNKGLAAVLLGEVDTGVKIMSDEQVPPEITARVIKGPQYHRKTDWKSG